MIMKNINWNWIYYFYEVARFSSIKEASRAMDVSLPTVSEQICRLEKELNVKLFKRSVRRLDLTDEGHSLYLLVKEMFRYGQKVLENVSPDYVGGSPVNIGIQAGITIEYSSHLISQYWDKYIPYGTISTEKVHVLDELIQSFSEGKFDWGITCETPATISSTKINYKKIGNAEILFCCSEDIYESFKDKKDILRYIPFVRNSYDTTLNDKISDYFTLNRCFPHEVSEIEQKDLIVDLVKKGRCISVFTESEAKRLARRDGIKGFYIDKPIYLDFYILWPRIREKSLIIKKLLEIYGADQEQEIEKHDSYLQLKIIDIPEERLVRKFS